jgi:hypothetical protein
MMGRKPKIHALEREAHTAIYAGMLKKYGAVVEGRKAQGQTQSAGPRPAPCGSSPLTVTSKTAAE